MMNMGKWAGLVFVLASAGHGLGLASAQTDEVRVTIAGSAEKDGESVGELIAILRSGDTNRRRAAVNKLVKIGTKEAWEGVIEALDNVEERAADEAQIDLAGMPDEKLFVTLFGRAGLGSKSRVVQLRVAELMGRRDVGIEAKRLKKALKHRDDEVRRLLLWSVERLAEADRLLDEPQKELGSDLIKMMRRDGDPAVRGAALYAYVAIFGEEASVEWVEKLAKDKAPPARCAAARWMRLVEPAVPFAAKLLGDEASSVRRAAVDGAAELARKGDREVIGLLIERLGAEERPRVEWRLVDILQEVSGMKYRRDPRPWQRWLEGLDDTWSVASAASKPSGLDRGEDTVAFAGLPILSDRVTFLIDLSGSIWNEKNGKLPKDLVGVQLNRALDHIHEDTLFNVIPYTNTPFPWQEEMVEAKPKAVKAAKAYFAECREHGAGNVYDAIQVALADERCDSLVILTDGAPSGGTHWNLNLMVPAFVEANRYRAVAFDSLLVGADKYLTRRWQDLAKETGGECISIELK
jgi:hypothetical protein